MALQKPGAARKVVNIARPSAMPPVAAEVETAIDALYDAAGDVTLLPDAIAKVTTCLRANRALLMVRPSHQIAAAPIFGQPWNFAPETLAQLADYWEGDPWSQGADRIGLQSGQVVVGEQLAETAAFRRSAIYADVLEPIEIPWLLAGVADKTAEDLVHMSVFRDDRLGPFNDQECKAMAALLPSLRIATRSAMQLQRYRVRAGALDNTLDAIDEAVFLVDLGGRVVTANAAAEALLAEQSDLTTVGRRLTARRGGTTMQIVAMLRAATVPGEAPGPVAVHDELGRPTLVLTPRPLRPAAQVRREAQLPGLPIAAVFATPARAERPATAKTLGALYGLTPAEARLTEKLATGNSLAETADALAITRETARSQLKAVFRKTETHRQSELVALALSLGVRPAR